MDPLVVRGCDNAKGKADRPVDEYLGSVRDLQQQYVELLAAAPDHLPQESRGLLAMCAVLARVTRLVFDAQRTFLDREVTVEVQLRDCSANDGVGDPLRLDEDQASVRQVIASLGCQVVRTPEDLDDLAELFTHAFEPDEPDTSDVMSGLRAVLDAWWEVRGRELAIVLADGRARASLEQHLTRMSERAAGADDGSVRAGDVGFAELLAELDDDAATARQEPPLGLIPTTDRSSAPLPAAVEFWLEADGGPQRPQGAEASVPSSREI